MVCSCLVPDSGMVRASWSENCYFLESKSPIEGVVQNVALGWLCIGEPYSQREICYPLEFTSPGRGNPSWVNKAPEARASRMQKIRENCCIIFCSCKLGKKL